MIVDRRTFVKIAAGGAAGAAAVASGVAMLPLAKRVYVRTMLPHIDQELLKQVQARGWMRPEDGKLE